DVRTTYGLPCSVMFAASPPVKFGISARLVSTMLTMNEPENTGPITTYAPWSTAFCASALAVCGADCVSIDVYSILRPRMPPAALISFTASFTPLSKFVPAVAPVPESSMSPTICTGPCCANTMPQAVSASAAAELRTKRFMTPPFWVGPRSGSAPERAAHPLHRSAACLGTRSSLHSVLRIDVMASVPRRRRLRGEPGRGLATARGDRRSRQMQVFVVDDVERVSPAIPGTLEASDEIDDRHVVVAFGRKHAPMPRGFD